MGGPAHPAAAGRPHHRLHDLHDAPHAGRRLQGDELRQEPRQARERRLAQGDLQGRGRRRRDGRGAAGDQGVPREPEEVPAARGAHPQGRAALRPAGHRQDAAGARRGRRGGGALLLHLGLRLRRDVRRRGRQPRARPLRAGQAEPPLHHLHGRDRRRGAAPGSRLRRRQRRARADPEPAAGRDGRLRDEGQHHPDRRHQPPRHLGPGAAAPGALRPPDRRRSPRPRRAAQAILEVHTRGKPIAKHIDLDTLAAQTPGFTGADLANLVNEAALLAARHGKKQIDMLELEEGIMRVLAGPREEEPPALREGEGHHRLPRDGPRPGGPLPGQHRPGAQDLDREPRAPPWASPSRCRPRTSS